MKGELLILFYLVFFIISIYFRLSSLIGMFVGGRRRSGDGGRREQCAPFATHGKRLVASVQ